jgi:hypothetical protein
MQHSHAVTLTGIDWSVCSRNRCPNKAGFTALFERRACRGVFYAAPYRQRDTVGT